MPTRSSSIVLAAALRALSMPALAAVGLAVGAGAAQAQPKGQGPGGRGACRAEIERFCADAGQDRDRRLCLQQHESELSEACRTRIAEGRQRREARADSLRAACSEDIEALCPDAEPGRGRGRCLRERAADLSDACREALKSHRRGPRAGGPPRR